MKTTNQQPIQFSLDPEVYYPKLEKLLWKLAWREHKISGLDLSDAYSQAVWSFMIGCKTYKPGLGTKPETYIYRKVRYELQTLRIRKEEDSRYLLHVDDEEKNQVPALQHEWQIDLFCGLSEDAREIVQLLIESPQELLDKVPMSARGLLARAMKHLQSLGRDRADLHMACDEIRYKLRESW